MNATPPSAAADQALKRRRLRTMQWVATSLLGVAAVLYAVATALSARHAAWGYVAAFAEAAMVGAIADWFAVVALFRHPLGMSFIPHTAIVPKNKARLADNLGRFVHTEFFATERVVAVIAAIDPAARLARWLGRTEHTARVGELAATLLTTMLNALDESAVRKVLRSIVSDRIRHFDFAHLAGQVLEHLTENRRHQKLLDQLLESLSALVNREQTQELLERAIAEKLPLYFDALKQKGAAAAARAMVKIFAKILAEIDANPDHAIRHAFDERLAEFIVALKNDPAYAAKIEQIKESLIQNRILTAYLDGIWRDVRAWIEEDLATPESRIRAQAASLAGQLGAHLADNADMRRWINDELLKHLPALVERYGPRLAQFIAEKMKSWKDEEIVQKIELNIGRDLQFIRINGTLVGGLIGLLIHAVTAALS